VNSNSLFGENANIHVNEVVRGSIREIQTLEIQTTSILAGTFSLSFKNHTTSNLHWNASAMDIKKELDIIPSIGLVSVERETGSNHYSSHSYVVTFLSYVGDAPILVACCDSTSEIVKQTIFSNITDDVKLNVTETVKGSSGLLSGFFQLVLHDVVPGAIVQTNPIDLSGSIQDIEFIMNEALGHTVTHVSKTISEDMVSYKIIFPVNPVNNEAVNVETAKLEVVSNMSVSNIKVTGQNVFRKEVQMIIPREESGEGVRRPSMVTCDDGTGNGHFSFSATSESFAIQKSIESVIMEDETLHYGKVLVEIGDTVESFKITFLEASGNVAEINCNNAADMYTVVNGTALAVSGTFTLSFESDNESSRPTSRPISYNASNQEVQNALAQISILMLLMSVSLLNRARPIEIMARHG
jgi:hypothetical protein